MSQKKILILIIALAGLLFMTTPSLAFYEYIDENGVTRYTDDINEVPADQREGKEEYTGTEPAIEEIANPDAIDTEKTEPTGTVQNQDKNYVYETALSDLKERQKNLIKEKELLKKEDDQLLKDKLKLKPGDDIAEYNEKAAILKQRTADLEEKQEAFNEKVQALNIEIEQYNEKVAGKLKTQLDEYNKTIKPDKPNSHEEE